MPTGTFTGIALELQSVTQTALATLRVRFTQPPLAISPSGPNDALNPTLYTLTGPGLYSILGVGSVYGDTQAFDVFLAGPLASGMWTLTVANALHAYDASSIQTPKSLSFSVSIVTPQEGVNPGAENDDAARILRKHLNPALKGLGWDSTIAAIAAGIQRDWDNGKSAFDQLFKTSASGLYLERKAADDGLSRPANIGMPDDLFRLYAIRTTNDKLTENSLLQILEIFYGQDSVRASVSTALSETFSIADGDELNLLIDEEKVVRVVFQNADFAIAGTAKAIEVAAAITRACRLIGSEAFALGFADPQTGQNKVRIYSGALGLTSSVRVTGGKAQNILQFSDALNIMGVTLPTWTITVDRVAGTVRFASDSVTSLDLSSLFIGDYVNIFGPQFDAANRGSFTVTNVYYAFPGGVKTQWFEVANTAGVAQVITQLSVTDMMFFRPTRKTVHTSTERAVIVSQPTQEVDIVLPATSQAVGRGPGTAAYNQVNASLPVSALERINGIVTVSVTGHGMAAGDQVQIDGAYGTPMLPPIIAPIASNEGSRSKGSIWSAPSNSFSPDGLTYNTSLIKMPSGRIAWVGGNWVNHPFAVDLLHAGINLQTYDFTSWTPQADSTFDFTFALATQGTITATAAPGSSLSAKDLLPAYASKLIYTGGWNSFDTIYKTAFYWDGSGAPVALADMSTRRAGHIQTSLDDGRVIVTGGMSLINRATNTCEIIDFGAGATWSAAASMSERRANHQQVKLGNGKLLAIGGRPLAQGHALDPDTIALYRFDTDTSISGSPGTLTSTSNGLHFVYAGAGTIGCSEPGESGNSIRVTAGSAHAVVSSGAPVSANMTPLYNTFLGTESTFEFWVHGQPLGSMFEMSRAVALDGTSATNVLWGIKGVTVDSGNGDKLTAYWHHGANVLVQLETTVAEMGGTAALFTWNHFAYVRTADTGGTVNVKLYVNGVLKKTWATQTLPDTASAATLYGFYTSFSPSAVASGNAPGLDDTRISNTAHNADAVFFGYQSSTGEFDYTATERIGRPLSTCEIYDPNANTWTVTGPMAHARVFHKAIVLPDDKVIVIGGVGYDPTQSGNSLQLKPILTAEIWSPITGTWSPCGSLAFARDSVVAEYLPSRKQIVVTGGTYSNTTELLDVEKRTWRLGSAVLPYKIHRGLSLVTDHETVLLVGGVDGTTHLTPLKPLLYVPNADNFLGGSLNGQFTIASVPDVNTFTFATPDQLAYTLLAPSARPTVTPLKAQPSSTPGPFMWDPKDGVSITGTESTLVMQLDKGHQYKSVVVADATKFPDANGWLVFDFGRETQVAPVRYFGRLSDTELAIDFGFRFPATVTAGANVSLLAGKGPYIPAASVAATVGSFYLTDSQAGRIAAESAIDASVAAGVKVNKTITYPGDRGLGGEGLPASGNYKLSDKVTVWGSDDQEADLTTARNT